MGQVVETVDMVIRQGWTGGASHPRTVCPGHATSKDPFLESFPHHPDFHPKRVSDSPGSFQKSATTQPQPRLAELWRWPRAPGAQYGPRSRGTHSWGSTLRPDKASHDLASVYHFRVTRHPDSFEPHSLRNPS